MEYDEDKVDEMVLALLFLTTFEESPYGARAWKGYDWKVLDRLDAKGYISDPKSKAKSVVVTEGGHRLIPPAKAYLRSRVGRSPLQLIW